MATFCIRNTTASHRSVDSEGPSIYIPTSSIIKAAIQVTYHAGLLQGDEDHVLSSHMQNMILCTFLIGCGLSKHNYYTDHCSVIRLIKEDGWDLGQEHNDYCMYT